MAQLWGGRFTKETDALVYRFNQSIGFDRRFFEQDVRGSMAHVRMLAKQEILTEEEKEQILAGLSDILRDVADGSCVITEEYEDTPGGSVRPARNCTPGGAGTIRWRWICVCISGTRSTKRRSCCSRSL